jgi:hypothetical protein
VRAGQDKKSPYYQTLNNSIDFWAKKANIDLGYPEQRYKQLVLQDMRPKGRGDLLTIFVGVYDTIKRMIPDIKAMKILGALLPFSRYEDDVAVPDIHDSPVLSEVGPYSMKGYSIGYLGKQYPVTDILNVSKIDDYELGSGALDDELMNKLASYFNKTLSSSTKIQLKSNIYTAYGEFLITDNTLRQIYPLKGPSDYQNLVENDWDSIL